jgi:hypothetical protein
MIEFISQKQEGSASEKETLGKTKKKMIYKDFT